jgi:hypothetical protein
MALAVKTIEFPFTTVTATLATGTTLAASAETVFAAITLDTPESSRTIRSAILETTFRGAEPTTIRNLDGVRIGVQIDAVAFNDADITGTGQAATGDQWSAKFSRDVTAYFVTNYTGVTHTAGVRFRAETSVADIVNNITMKLILTYEYEDTATTHIKTVRIPMEGITGFLPTVANSDMRGSTGAQQIPLLNTFLPEDTKVFKHIWFEVEATDGGAATTDFNINYSIDGGATATRATLEQGLNTSVRFFDIWIQNALDTSAIHDFEAWSSLASRFERLFCTLYVTYTFNATNSTTIMNSVIIPIENMGQNSGQINGTSNVDQDRLLNRFLVNEPATVTLMQSAVRLFYIAAGATNITVQLSANGQQGVVTSTYTTTALVHSGAFSLQHRIDISHGGVAPTLVRGDNFMYLQLFQSVNNQATLFSGYYILNYTSGKSAVGVGSHNQTTFWSIADTMSQAIAGTATLEVATTNQRTPNIPQANWWLNGLAIVSDYFSSANGYTSLLAERAAGESDGWWLAGMNGHVGDSEIGWHTYVYSNLYPLCARRNDMPFALFDWLKFETARKYRRWGSSVQVGNLYMILTTTSITFAVSGTVYTANGYSMTLDLFTVTYREHMVRISSNGVFNTIVFDDLAQIQIRATRTAPPWGGVSKQAVPGPDFNVYCDGKPKPTLQIGI